MKPKGSISFLVLEGLTAVDGTLLREENGSIFVVLGYGTRHVPDPATLEPMATSVPTPRKSTSSGVVNAPAPTPP